jgi:hypothetical protein
MMIKEWIRDHKIATAVIIIVVLLIGWIVLTMLVSLSGARYRARDARIGYQDYSDSLNLESPLGLGSRPEVAAPSASVEEVEVKEGSMTIESEDAEEDFTEIESITGSYQGYVERSNKSITNLYVKLNLTLRVPSEGFAGLVDKLKERFEVESYNVKNYRIPIGRELDEIQILNQSLADYEKIRDEINEMRVGKDKIDLLMQLTDKELKLKEKERNYQRALSSKEKRGEYATLNVSLREKKSPTVWPENVLDQFKDRLRRALDNVVKILKDLMGGSIELFFQLIQFAVYIFIIGIVAAAFYRLGKILFRLIIRKKEPPERM